MGGCVNSMGTGVSKLHLPTCIHHQWLLLVMALTVQSSVYALNACSTNKLTKSHITFFVYVQDLCEFVLCTHDYTH